MINDKMAHCLLFRVLLIIRLLRGVCLDMKLNCSLYIQFTSILFLLFRFIFIYLSFFTEFYFHDSELFLRYRVIFMMQSYFLKGNIF